MLIIEMYEWTYQGLFPLVNRTMFPSLETKIPFSPTLPQHNHPFQETTHSTGISFSGTRGTATGILHQFSQLIVVPVVHMRRENRPSRAGPKEFVWPPHLPPLRVFWESMPVVTASFCPIVLINVASLTSNSLPCSLCPVILPSPY